MVLWRELCSEDKLLTPMSAAPGALPDNLCALSVYNYTCSYIFIPMLLILENREVNKLISNLIIFDSAGSLSAL